MALATDAAHACRRSLVNARAVVVDVGADPDMAVAVCQALSADWPTLPMLAIVCCPRPTMPWHMRELLAHGAHDLFDAHVRLQELTEAVVALARGDLATRVQLHGLYDGLGGLSAGLGIEEQRLIQLVANGHSDAEIGVKLELSERSVRNRLEHLRAVLNVGSRAEMAAWAGAHGFYRPRDVSIN